MIQMQAAILVLTITDYNVGYMSLRCGENRAIRIVLRWPSFVKLYYVLTDDFWYFLLLLSTLCSDKMCPDSSCQSFSFSREFVAVNAEGESNTVAIPFVYFHLPDPSPSTGNGRQLVKQS